MIGQKPTQIISPVPYKRSTKVYEISNIQRKYLYACLEEYTRIDFCKLFIVVSYRNIPPCGTFLYKQKET
jgi:hypothetical protein